MEEREVTSEKLVITGFALDGAAADALAEFIGNGDYGFGELDLSGCNLGDEMVVRIMQSVVNVDVHTVNLSFTNIGIRGVAAVAKLLDSITCKLRKLIVKYNPLTAQGLGLLLKWGCGLAEIDAKYCGMLTESSAESLNEGIAFLTEGIRENTSCSSLLLAGNNFGEKEKIAVYSTLRQNKRSGLGGVGCINYEDVPLPTASSSPAQSPKSARSSISSSGMLPIMQTDDEFYAEISPFQERMIEMNKKQTDMLLSWGLEPSGTFARIPKSAKINVVRDGKDGELAGGNVFGDRSENLEEFVEILECIDKIEFKGQPGRSGRFGAGPGSPVHRPKQNPGMGGSFNGNQSCNSGVFRLGSVSGSDYGMIPTINNNATYQTENGSFCKGLLDELGLKRIDSESEFSQSRGGGNLDKSLTVKSLETSNIRRRREQKGKDCHVASPTPLGKRRSNQSNNSTLKGLTTSPVKRSQTLLTVGNDERKTTLLAEPAPKPKTVVMRKKRGNTIVTLPQKVEKKKIRPRAQSSPVTKRGASPKPVGQVKPKPVHVDPPRPAGLNLLEVETNVSNEEDSPQQLSPSHSVTSPSHSHRNRSHAALHSELTASKLHNDVMPDMVLTPPSAPTGGQSDGLSAERDESRLSAGRSLSRDQMAHQLQREAHHGRQVLPGGKTEKDRNYFFAYLSNPKAILKPRTRKAHDEYAECPSSPSTTYVSRQSTVEKVQAGASAPQSTVIKSNPHFLKHTAAWNAKEGDEDVENSKGYEDWHRRLKTFKTSTTPAPSRERSQSKPKKVANISFDDEHTAGTTGTSSTGRNHHDTGSVPTLPQPLGAFARDTVCSHRKFLPEVKDDPTPKPQPPPPPPVRRSTSPRSPPRPSQVVPTPTHYNDATASWSEKVHANSLQRSASAGRLLREYSMQGLAVQAGESRGRAYYPGKEATQMWQKDPSSWPDATSHGEDAMAHASREHCSRRMQNGEARKKGDKQTPAILKACLTSDAACRELLGTWATEGLKHGQGAEFGVPFPFVSHCGLPDTINELPLGCFERVGGLVKILFFITAVPCTAVEAEDGEIHNLRYLPGIPHHLETDDDVVDYVANVAERCGGTTHSANKEGGFDDLRTEENRMARRLLKQHLKQAPTRMTRASSMSSINSRRARPRSASRTRSEDDNLNRSFATDDSDKRRWNNAQSPRPYIGGKLNKVNIKEHVQTYLARPERHMYRISVQNKDINNAGRSPGGAPAAAQAAAMQAAGLNAPEPASQWPFPLSQTGSIFNEKDEPSKVRYVTQLFEKYLEKERELYNVALSCQRLARVS